MVEKDLSKPYKPCMAEQVRRAGMPAPRATGIDEIAIHKGHKYRAVVSDLERGRPIWFGGSGRTEADIDLQRPAAPKSGRNGRLSGSAVTDGRWWAQVTSDARCLRRVVTI